MVEPAPEPETIETPYGAVVRDPDSGELRRGPGMDEAHWSRALAWALEHRQTAAEPPGWRPLGTSLAGWAVAVPMLVAMSACAFMVLHGGAPP